MTRPDPAKPLASLGGRPDPFFLPYERRSRTLVEVRCSSLRRGQSCGSVLGAVYETPWGDIWTACPRSRPPSRSMRSKVKGTAPDRVVPVSFYLDFLEEAWLDCPRCRRAQNEVGLLPEDLVAWAAEAREKGSTMVVPIPIAEVGA